MQRTLPRLLAAAILAASGCSAPGDVVPDPPAPIHPTDLFPAPPGFSATRVADGHWRFTGPGRVSEGADFFRASCIELFRWRPVEDARQADGSWRLQFRRDGRTLRVHVRGTDDTLACDVTLRGADALAPGSEPASG